MSVLWDTVEILETKGWEGQGDFSLCVGHSGNPRVSLSVLRTKGWVGQRDFSAVCGTQWKSQGLPLRPWD